MDTAETDNCAGFPYTGPDTLEDPEDRGIVGTWWVDVLFSSTNGGGAESEFPDQVGDSWLSMSLVVNTDGTGSLETITASCQRSGVWETSESLPLTWEAIEDDRWQLDFEGQDLVWTCFIPASDWHELSCQGEGPATTQAVSLRRE